MLSSASVEPEPSKVHVRFSQVVENRATGGSLVGGASAAGRSRIVHIAVAVARASAVAVKPPVLAGVPAVSAAPRSSVMLRTEECPFRSWWHAWSPSTGQSSWSWPGSCPSSRRRARRRSSSSPPREWCARQSIRLTDPADGSDRVRRIYPRIGRERDCRLRGCSAGQAHSRAGIAGDRGSSPHGGGKAVVDEGGADLRPSGARPGQRHGAVVGGNSSRASPALVAAGIVVVNVVLEPLTVDLPTKAIGNGSGGGGAVAARRLRGPQRSQA